MIRFSRPLTGVTPVCMAATNPLNWHSRLRPDFSHSLDLVLPGAPDHVSGCIVAAGGTLEGVLRARARAKIGDERLERVSPFGAHLDPLRSIVGVRVATEQNY